MGQKLFLLANMMTRFIGKDEESTGMVQWSSKTPDFVKNIINPIFDVLGWLLPVIMILLGIAGTIFVIVLGVNYAKAESADQKDAAKKRLINVVIGVLVMILGILLVFIFIKNANTIFGWVETTAGSAAGDAAAK